jgi:MFS family permease
MSSSSVSPVTDTEAALRADRAGPRRLEGVAAFAVVTGGQVVSLFGSQLTTFALGVWVFQQTRSATAFALIAFFGVVPEIAASPLAGAVVDRWDRRRTLIVSDAGSCVCTAILATGALSGGLALWAIYALVAASSAFRSLQFPPP